MVKKFEIIFPVQQEGTDWARGLDTGILYRRRFGTKNWVVVATPRPFARIKEGDIVSTSFISQGRGFEHLLPGTIITIEL